MAGEFIEFFQELLLGSGSLIGLILVIVLLLIIAVLNKYGGILSWAISAFVGFMYIEHNMFWDAILMFIAGFFMLYFSVHEVRKK